MASPTLLDACRQSEAILLRSLWPAPEKTEGSPLGVESDANDALFREAFALALESTGGFGVAGQLALHLQSVPR